MHILHMVYCWFHIPKLLRPLSFPAEVETQVYTRLHVLNFWPACLWQVTGVMDASTDMHGTLPPDDSWLESLQCPICLVRHFPNHLSVLQTESSVECCLLITAVVISMHSIGWSDVISQTLTALFYCGWTALFRCNAKVLVQYMDWKEIGYYRK